MMQKEALLMPQAEVSESDTVTTQGFVRQKADRQKADYVYLFWSENINYATGVKLVGKIGILGMLYGGLAQLDRYPPLLQQD